MVPGKVAPAKFDGADWNVTSCNSAGVVEEEEVWVVVWTEVCVVDVVV